MSDQRTLKESGLPRQIGRMTEDAATIYWGGVAKLELAKGHPRFVKEMYQLWDRLASEQAIRMRLPFATITVGNFNSVDDLRLELMYNGYRTNDWAEHLVIQSGFKLQTQPGTLSLCRASNLELGFPYGCDYMEGFKALEKIGAKKLPPETGAQFRMQYTRLSNN